MSEFRDCAVRLAGFAGAALGWPPDAFWRATPAELAAVVTAPVASCLAVIVTPDMTAPV